MENRTQKTATERYLEKNSNYKALQEMINDSTQRKVELTQKEIEKGKQKKREMKANPKTFANTPIYRTFHNAMHIMQQIVKLMPKKNVRISDISVYYLAEAMHWASSAYEQSELQIKLYSLSESISLMNTVRMCVNTSSSLNMIGKAKSTQLTSAMNSIMRQLVAWRGSLNGKGDNERD